MAEGGRIVCGGERVVPLIPSSRAQRGHPSRPWGRALGRDGLPRPCGPRNDGERAWGGGCHRVACNDGEVRETGIFPLKTTPGLWLKLVDGPSADLCRDDHRSAALGFARAAVGRAAAAGVGADCGAARTVPRGHSAAPARPTASPSDTRSGKTHTRSPHTGDTSRTRPGATDATDGAGSAQHRAPVRHCPGCTRLRRRPAPRKRPPSPVPRFAPDGRRAAPPRHGAIAPCCKTGFCVGVKLRLNRSGSLSLLT